MSNLAWGGRALPNSQRILDFVVRSAIIVGVLLATLAFSYLLARGINPVYILALSAALIGGILMYKLSSFQYGILAVILAAGTIGFFSLPTGRESRVVISLLLSVILVAVWLGWPLIHKGSSTGPLIRPSPINRITFAFIGVNIVSYIWSNLLRDPLVVAWPSFPLVQIAALLVNCLLPLMALFLITKLDNIKWWRYIVYIVLAVGFFGIYSEFFRLPTSRMTENGMRGLFSMWAGGFAFALLLFDDKLRVWQRGFLVVLLFGFVTVNMLAKVLWLSGWLPMAVAWGVIGLVHSRKVFAIMLTLALIVIGVNAAPIYQEVIQANIDEGGTERFELWATNLTHVGNHPLFGMGPAGYAVYNMTYNARDARSTHNNYFDILAQTGIIGFIIFLGLMRRYIALGIANVRKLSKQRGFEPAFAAATLAGAVGAMVGMMLGDWVLPFAYNQTITGFDNAVLTWVFLGGIVSLHLLCQQPDVASERKAP